MKNIINNAIIKINCPGGIVTPGVLTNLCSLVKSLDIAYIKFGLRQHIFIYVHRSLVPVCISKLKSLDIEYELDENQYPNIMSGYVAEEVFVTNTWLTEGTYKDILDSFDFKPTVKVNISDAAQSFIPLFTGNINFIASGAHPHYWHVYLRPPKTNTIVKCKYMVYSNEISAFAKEMEFLLTDFPPGADQESINSKLDLLIRPDKWISIPNQEQINWPAYQLPYYEGLNKVGDRYWLGIYSRHEWFDIAFLADLCSLCRDCHIGQVCITPWKSIIIKGITDNTKGKWNQLLNFHHINIRHAANELNFQVEDNSDEALALKLYLYQHLQTDDIRTQGICFGIKTTPKTEIFSNILIRKSHLIRVGWVKLFPVYDILVAKDFNPNERTGFVYSQNLFKYLLPETLEQCVNAHYRNRLKPENQEEKDNANVNTLVHHTDIATEIVHQCPHCLTWADEYLLSSLGQEYACSVCETPMTEFKEIEIESREWASVQN